MRRGRRNPDPDFIGRSFAVYVADGNGRDYLFHSVTPIGPVATHVAELTPQQADDIEVALEAALKFWRGHKPKGGGEVVNFRRDA